MKFINKALIIFCLAFQQVNAVTWDDARNYIQATYYEYFTETAQPENKEIKTSTEKPKPVEQPKAQELPKKGRAALRNNAIETIKETLSQIKENEKKLQAVAPKLKEQEQKMLRSPYAPALEAVVPAAATTAGALAGYLVYAYGLKRFFTPQKPSIKAIQQEIIALAQEIETKRSEYEALQKTVTESSAEAEQQLIQQQLEEFELYFTQAEMELQKLQHMLAPGYMVKPGMISKVLDFVTFALCTSAGAYAGYFTQKSFFANNPYYTTATAEEQKIYVTLLGDKQKIELNTRDLKTKKRLYEEFKDALSGDLQEDAQQPEHKKELASEKKPHEQEQQFVAHQKGSNLFEGVS